MRCRGGESSASLERSSLFVNPEHPERNIRGVKLRTSEKEPAQQLVVHRTVIVPVVFGQSHTFFGPAANQRFQSMAERVCANNGQRAIPCVPFHKCDA